MPTIDEALKGDDKVSILVKELSNFYNMASNKLEIFDPLDRDVPTSEN